MKKQWFSVTKPPHHTLIQHIEVATWSSKHWFFIWAEYPVSLHYIRLYIYICSMNDSQMFTVVKSQKTKCTLRIYVKEIIKSICVLSCEEAMCGFRKIFFYW